jgi:hypothetical protein
VLVERLETMRELASTGEIARTVSVIESPLSQIRQVFELMASDTTEDVEHIAARLVAVRPALTSRRRRSRTRWASACGSGRGRTRAHGLAIASS